MSPVVAACNDWLEEELGGHIKATFNREGLVVEASETDDVTFALSVYDENYPGNIVPEEILGAVKAEAQRLVGGHETISVEWMPPIIH